MNKIMSEFLSFFDRHLRFKEATFWFITVIFPSILLELLNIRILAIAENPIVAILFNVVMILIVLILLMLVIPILIQMVKAISNFMRVERRYWSSRKETKQKL